MTEPEIRIVSIPMLDTGLGREAGFKDDAELIERAKEERAALVEKYGLKVGEILDEVDAEVERRLLFGDGYIETAEIDAGREERRRKRWTQL